MPRRGESPQAVKNWTQIRSITFSERCPTKYTPDKEGDLTWAACPEGDGMCTITITFGDGKTQTHTVKRGGGVEKKGDTVTRWEKGVFKCD